MCHTLKLWQKRIYISPDYPFNIRSALSEKAPMINSHQGGPTSNIPNLTLSTQDTAHASNSALCIVTAAALTTPENKTYLDVKDFLSKRSKMGFFWLKVTKLLTQPPFSSPLPPFACFSDAWGQLWPMFVWDGGKKMRGNWIKSE